MIPALLLAVAIAAVLGGAEWLTAPRDAPQLVATDIGVGLAYCVAGVFAIRGRGSARIAVLFESIGLTWLIGGVAPVLLDLYVGPLVHLLLAYPTGRIAGRAGAVVVSVAYLLSALSPLPFVRAALPLLFVVVAIVCLAATFGPSVARRRGRAPAAIAAVAIAAASLTLRLGTSFGTLDPDAGRQAYAIVLAASAVLLVTQLHWASWSEDAVARLVIELGDSSHAATLRGTLADVLGDSSLVVGLASGSEGDFVDEAGRPVVPPEPDSDRQARFLTVGRDRVGILIRDRAVDVDEALIDGVAAAAQLAITNARLHADARGRLRSLEASRRRVLDAADTERFRIRDDLQAGMEQRLAKAELLLAEGDAALRPAPGDTSLVDQIRAIRAELRQLTRGIGSSVLAADGLAAAIGELVRASPITVETTIPPRRWPAVTERTAYFVCSEGLANATRHSQASRINVRVVERTGALDVEIVDDGIGGASPASGSGLRGLTDRVEAIGGSLQVRERRPRGTRLLATLPLDGRLREA